ncbi:MAG TPA: hypothetical protein VJ801_09280 [Polyangia bacterium]|jgi:hypothetical protein|nr:hypothetical protein [Polyangia bacterium]
MKRILLALAMALFGYMFLSPHYLFPDGQGYYAYLPSLFFDGDLQLFNEFLYMRIPVPLALTETGYISNNWQIGAALLWTPFFLLGKLFATAGTHPHSAWFWFWVNFGTMFYGVLAVLLLFKLANTERLGSGTALCATACALAGTPAFFYIFIMQSNAIGLTAFTSALFIWYWIASMKEPERPQRYLLLGLTLGVAAMVRSQEVLLGLAPATELLHRCIKKTVKMAPAARHATLAVASFCIGFSPQLISWKVVNGSFFAAPAAFNLSWKNYALDRVLFSPYHGILFWTPVYFIAAIGLVAGLRSKPLLSAGALLVFAAQLFVNSCCAAFWEGHSFGLRQMTGLLPIVFLGVARYLEYFAVKRTTLRCAGYGILAASVLWTMGLTGGYFAGLDLQWPPTVVDLLTAEVNAVRVLPSLPGRLLGLQKIGLGWYSLMMLAALLLLWLGTGVLKSMEGKKAYLALGTIVAVVLAYDITLAKAATNKPAYEIPREYTITQKQLDSYFMKLIEDTKRKYGIE